MNAICDVCQILDHDKSLKEVHYCHTCDAYICKDCENNWLRRGIAAIKLKLTTK